MKNIIFQMTVFGAVALAAAATASAQTQAAPPGYTTTSHLYFWPGYTGQQPGQPGDIYFDAELGGNLQQDMIVRNVGQKVPFDPGEAFTFSVGGDITDALGVEFETGVNWNTINTSGSQSFLFAGNNADLYQVPFVVNLIFRAPLPGGLTPYIGAGGGGVASTLEAGYRHNWSSDTDVTFAYQALAGVRCALNRHLELGVGYKFLGTPSHTWFANDPVLYTPAGQTFSHSILATLTLSF